MLQPSYQVLLNVPSFPLWHPVWSPSMQNVYTSFSPFLLPILIEVDKDDDDSFRLSHQGRDSTHLGIDNSNEYRNRANLIEFPGL